MTAIFQMGQINQAGKSSLMRTIPTFQDAESLGQR